MSLPFGNFSLNEGARKAKPDRKNDIAMPGNCANFKPVVKYGVTKNFHQHKHFSRFQGRPRAAILNSHHYGSP